MMYSLIFDEKAIDELNKLPKITKKRIFNKLQVAKENPHYYFSRLVGRTEYKLRVGDYRVIADINDKEIKILVFHVLHRSKVYKRI